MLARHAHHAARLAQRQLELGFAQHGKVGDCLHFDGALSLIISVECLPFWT